MRYGKAGSPLSYAIYVLVYSFPSAMDAVDPSKKEEKFPLFEKFPVQGGGSGGVLPVLNYDSFLYFDLFFVAALPNILLLHIISLRMASPFLLYSQEAMQLVRKNKTIQQDKMRSLETCFLANMLQDYFHNLKKNQVRK